MGAPTLQKYGSSFAELAAKLKRDFAETSLQAGSMSITEIGEVLGYSAVSAFSRAFKGWTGISPAGFRKRHSD